HSLPQNGPGGLGILDLKTVNEALVGKWLWRFATERGSWWRNLIVLKYEVGPSEWCPNRVSDVSSGSMWTRIIQFGSSFWRYAFINPGGGFCSFWKDFWVEGERLADHFQRVEAAVARTAGSRECDFLSFDRSEWIIPLRFELRGGA
ncbi:hypothetical protein LINPERPRIM_LOCUS7532, partial [Linum perenne]